MNLQELRQKYPQYNHLSDEQFSRQIGLGRGGADWRRLARERDAQIGFDVARRPINWAEELAKPPESAPAKPKYDWAEILNAPATDEPSMGAREHDYAEAVFDPAYHGRDVQRTAGAYETPTGRATLLDGAVPEPIEGSGAGFAANLKGNIPEDEETRIALIAKARFPNDPDATRGFGRINGRLVFVNERGQYEYADSGFRSKAGAILSSVPEVVGSVVGSLATLNPFSGSVIGGVGGRGVKRILSALLFDEPQTTSGNLASMAEEGVVGTFAGALGKTGALAYNRAAVRNAERFDMPQAVALRERIKRSTGIELDLAQAGNIRQLRDLKKWAAKFPSESQEIIEGFDSKQAAQVARAVEERVLSALARETDPSRLANSGINAARAAIELAKMQRSVETRLAYKQADAVILDGHVVREFLEDPFFSQELRKVLGNKLYQSEFKDIGMAENVRDRSIKAWDLVLRNIRDMESEAIRSGANNKARLAGQRAKRLEDRLAEVDQDYAAARQLWAEKSAEYVEPLENGVVGVLAKIEGPKAAQHVARVMNDILASPQATQAAKLILQRQGAQAWRDLVKASLSRQFDRAAKETQSGDVVNLAGKFRQAVIGTPQRKAAMEKALGGEGVTAFNDVMEALQRIATEARNRGGSDTAFNQEITNLQRGGALTSLTRFVTAPAKTIRDALDEKVLQNNSVAIAEALADPAKLGRLKELRKLKPSTERAVAILSVVGIGQPTGAAVHAISSPATDRAAPIAATRAR